MLLALTIFIAALAVVFVCFFKNREVAHWRARSERDYEISRDYSKKNAELRFQLRQVALGVKPFLPMIRNTIDLAESAE